MFYLPGKVIVRISGGFWFVAAMIGLLQGANLVSILMWMAIVAISVLFHEMGHAYMAKLFKQKPTISLVPFGGITTFEGKNISLGKQFLVTLNGPLFGFILFFFAFLVRKSGVFSVGLFSTFFHNMELVNLVWSVINLFPILPMDGGQLLRIVLEAAFGTKGVRLSFLSSLILALALAFGAFAIGQFLLGAFLFFFAFQSIDMWIKSRNLTAKDRDSRLAILLEEGEQALRQENLPQAEKIFQDVRSRTKKGILYVAATQYLAFIEKEKKNDHLAYELLLSLEKELSPEAKILLHDLAFMEENYSLVATLSKEVFEYKPSQMIALHNARAFGFLKKPEEAGGWLHTALEFGGLDKSQILLEKPFLNVKEDPKFLEFFPKE